jgi:hypothetical protein
MQEFHLVIAILQADPWPCPSLSDREIHELVLGFYPVHVGMWRFLSREQWPWWWGKVWIRSLLHARSCSASSGRPVGGGVLLRPPLAGARPRRACPLPEQELAAPTQASPLPKLTSACPCRSWPRRGHCWGRAAFVRASLDPPDLEPLPAVDDLLELEAPRRHHSPR